MLLCFDLLETVSLFVSSGIQRVFIPRYVSRETYLLSLRIILSFLQILPNAGLEVYWGIDYGYIDSLLYIGDMFHVKRKFVT